MPFCICNRGLDVFWKGVNLQGFSVDGDAVRVIELVTCFMNMNFPERKIIRITSEEWNVRGTEMHVFHGSEEDPFEGIEEEFMMVWPGGILSHGRMYEFQRGEGNLLEMTGSRISHDPTH